MVRCRPDKRSVWMMTISVQADGEPMPGVSCRRVDNRLPALAYVWESETASVKMTVAGAADCDIFQIRATSKIK